MNTDLLVPVRLRALVVNDLVRGRDSFLRWVPNYGLLRLRRSPDLSPFNADTGFVTDPDRDGVYLHWELPAALRRATTPGGEVTLPPAPNRWLVVRHAYTAKGDYTTAAWVVESDFLDSLKGTAPYLQPGTVVPTKIGRRTEAARWTESAVPQPTFLTAIGPGSLSFAAFQPHCQNVFSFHDPLTLLPDPYDRLGYQVIGWHAADSDDPLADPKVRETLESSLGWRTDGTPPPGTRTVYTGRVHSVLRRHDPSDEQWPDPVVAVGDSAGSALTALAADKAATDTALTLAPALLEQLQSGTLDRADEVDNAHRLADIRHGAGFAEGTTAYSWHALPPSTAQEPPTPHEEQQAREAEADLNAAQHAYNEAERELAGLRRRLYGMWRLHGLRVPDAYKQRLAQELDLRRADSLAARVRTLREEADRLGAGIPGGETPEQLAAAIGRYVRDHLPAGWDLKRVAPAPFHRALDPAIVLQGAGSLPAPDDTALPCRFGDRTVTAVDHARRPDGLTAERGDLACNTLDLGPGERSAMPRSTRALVREAFLLDPNCPVVQLGADSRPVTGTAPTPRTGIAPAFGGDPWEQPWNPLHLLWQIEYFPLPHGQWEFDGEDYICASPRPEAKLTHTGRTLLSDHLPRSLAGRIRQYALQAPELAPHCGAPAYRVEAGDILSSSLAGLRDLLIGQDPGQGVPPLGAPAELVDLIGDAYRTNPRPGLLPDGRTGRQGSGFQQLRAGQFRFVRLTLVDSFGRALDVISRAGTGGTSAHRHPVVADRLRPQHVPEALGTTPEHVVQLPPRLPQAARLGLELMDATRDTYEATYLGDGNPIAGWIVPNAIDGSLAVYEADGTPLGLLRRAYRLGRPAPETVWSPLPREPAGLPALPAASPHLQQLIDWFQGADAEDSPLAATLGILNTSLVDVLPTAGATSASAALAGRPLAVVRCRLRLDLDGPPPTDPGWQHVFDPEPPSPEFTGYRWPVRLGEQQRVGDGLVGYFSDTERGVLRTVAEPDGTHPGLAAVGDGTHLHVTAMTPEHLTLLADPHAPVHVTTGLLPTTTLEIPRRLTDGPLDRIRTILRSGPLLTPATPSREDPVALPVRTVDDQTWTWAERASDGTTWTHFATSAASTTPRWTGRPPVLRSGLLTSLGPPPPAADTTSP